MLARSMTEHGSNLNAIATSISSWLLAGHPSTIAQQTTHSTPPRITLTGRFRWWEIARALLPCTHAWLACCRDTCNGFDDAGSVIDMQQSQCTSSRPGRDVYNGLSRFQGV